MTWPTEVKNRALLACARHCCICHKFCGTKIELHHIILRSEGGTEEFENCIPLCFDCHSDQSSYDHKHPKGTKYTATELNLHRETWFHRIKSTIFSLPSDTFEPQDRKIFAEISKLLKWDTTIYFLKTHDFGGLFQRENLNPLNEYQARELDPSFEFFDAELETIRSTLTSSINSFIGKVHVECDIIETSYDWLRVPKKWELIDSPRYFAAIKALNQLATDVGKTYDELIRNCRRKLKDL
jgi:hypothetical protein